LGPGYSLLITATLQNCIAGAALVTPSLKDAADVLIASKDVEIVIVPVTAFAGDIGVAEDKLHALLIARAISNPNLGE
jgi:hypothetical protein